MDERIAWFIEELKREAAARGESFVPPADMAEQIEERAGSEGKTIDDVIVELRAQVAR